MSNKEIVSQWSLTQFEKELLDAADLEEVMELFINGETLHPLQALDVVKMMVRKTALCMYGTGTGKTYIASALIRWLYLLNPESRVLMFVKNNQLSQTPADVEKLTGLRVESSDATQKSLRTLFDSGDFLRCSVLMLTHQCLNNRDLMGLIFKYKNDFNALIIDEAHNLNNVHKASTAGMLRGVCSHFEYKWALTATPIVSSLDQFVRLACMLDPDKYPNPEKLYKQLTRHEISFDYDPCFFIQRTRKDLGFDSCVRGIPIIVPALDYQKRARRADRSLICKGSGAINSVTALVNLIVSQKSQHRRGIVYVRMHEVREFILPFLEQAGIEYACINGYTSLKDRNCIMEKFNKQGKYDVVITSVEEALNLDCEYVLFYELTINVDQVVGRAYRGLYTKTLDVYFMMVAESEEIEYFRDTILPLTQLVKDVVNVEYTAVTDVANELMGGGHD